MGFEVLGLQLPPLGREQAPILLLSWVQAVSFLEVDLCRPAAPFSTFADVGGSQLHRLFTTVSAGVAPVRGGSARPRWGRAPRPGARTGR